MACGQVRSTFDGIVSTIRNKTPVSFASKSTLSLPWMTPGGMESYLRSYGTVGTVFAIVGRTADSVSRVKWHLYRSSPSGRKEERTEVTSHAALDIWNRPNKFHTRKQLMEAVEQHVGLTGEGWTLIARNPSFRSLPLELWPVRPDRMTPVPSSTEFIAGYYYTGPDGEKVPLETDSVLRIIQPHPLDPYRGMGAIQSILIDLDSTRYSAEWNRNFFLNSAEPGGIIEVDKRLTDDEFTELTTRWREQHQGVAQAHRVAVIEQGKWVDKKYTQRDMQFAELRLAGEETIRKAFGFPKFMLGSVDDVNRAQGEASVAMFAQWLVVPRLERWREMLNSQFLPLFGPQGKGVEFDFDDPVPSNYEANNAERDSKVNAAVALVGAGFDPVETLAALDLPPLTFEKPEPPKPPIQATATVGQAPEIEALVRVLEGRRRDDDRSDRPFRREYWS